MNRRTFLRAIGAATLTTAIGAALSSPRDVNAHAAHLESARRHQELYETAHKELEKAANRSCVRYFTGLLSMSN